MVLRGEPLAPADVAALGRGAAVAEVDPAALARVAAAHDALRSAHASGVVYGAGTGVGANRHEAVAADDEGGHGLRLLRSHCAATGPEIDDAAARAALAVRLNQLLAGGSGASPALAAGLARALATGAVPRLHAWGAVGTGDLAQLAELGLTLAGHRPWRSGPQQPPVTLAATDALPLMSSSAVTLALAALAATDLRAALRGGAVVTGLTHLAARGNPQAYDDAVHRARPHPRQRAAAEAVRRLIGGGDAGRPGPARLQDPFALRTAPQVLAPALDALDALEGAVALECGAAAENPLVTEAGVHHHGQFHAATLAVALDTAAAAAHPVLTLSAARLALLLRPEHPGQRAFLAAGPAGSSGLIIGEYVVQDVLAQLRPAPATAGALSISLGLEEHASFATQGARALRRVADLAPTVVAVELLAARRVLAAHPERLAGAVSRRAAELSASVLDDGVLDAPIGPALARGAAVLPDLAALVADLL